MARRKTPYPKNPPDAVEWLDRKAEWECQIIATESAYEGTERIIVRGPEKRGTYSRLMIDLFWDTHPGTDDTFTHKAFHCQPCPRCDDWSRTERNCPEHPETTVAEMFPLRSARVVEGVGGRAHITLTPARFQELLRQVPATPVPADDHRQRAMGPGTLRTLAETVLAEAQRVSLAGPHVEGNMMGLPVTVDRAAGRIHPGMGVLPEEWAQLVEGDPEHFASTPGTDRIIRERNAQRERSQTTQIRAETDHGPAVVTYTREDG